MFEGLVLGNLSYFRTPAEQDSFNRRLLLALAELSKHPAFVLLLEDLVLTVLLRPSADDFDEGERRLVLKIREGIRQGLALSEGSEG